MKRELPHFLILILMFALVLYFWNQVPEESPVHWGIDGQPDRYGGRFEALMVFPIIAVGVYLLLLVIPLLQPEKMKAAKARRTYDQIRLVTLVFMLGLQILSLLQIKGSSLSFPDLFMPLMGLFYIALGQIIARAPVDSKFINVPFEIKNEESLKEFTRYVGNVITFIGVVIIPSALFTFIISFILFIVLNVLMVVLMFLKAYKLSQAEGSI